MEYGYKWQTKLYATSPWPPFRIFMGKNDVSPIFEGWKVGSSSSSSKRSFTFLKWWLTSRAEGLEKKHNDLSTGQTNHHCKISPRGEPTSYASSLIAKMAKNQLPPTVQQNRTKLIQQKSSGGSRAAL